MELQTVRGVMGAKAPFDFGKSLAFVCGFSPTAGEQRVGEASLAKAIQVRGRAMLCELEATERREELAWALHAAGEIDEATREEALARVRFHLSLEDDLAPFYALAERDDAFRPVARELRGLHHVKFASLAEVAAWSILVQRTPMLIARKMKDALVARFGGVVVKDGVAHRAFPELGTLASAGGDAIAEVVRHRPKAEAIAAVARALHERGQAWLETAPYAEADRWLRSLPRIGEWSSAFILFRGLGRMERMSDRGGPLYRAARGAYGDVSDAAIDRIADGYGAWRGYWALYLRVAA
jgi:DNA-3-methyladenine glycosylase II